MTTIKNVAQRTGVSVTTVSRALNDYDDVAEDTRSRIKRTAELLDYHPNKVARSLQGSCTNVVALVVPFLLHRPYDAFWLEFLGGMAVRCADEGCDVLLSVSEAHDAPNPAFERLVRGHGVDGLILCDLRRNDARIGYMARHKLPFVAFGRTCGEQNYPFIDVDGDAGAYQAVQHLIGLGHRRIGYLGVDPSFSFSHFRLQGYCRALEQSECPRDPLLVREALSEENAEHAARAMLTLPGRPTAVFAAADFWAWRC
jgi:LacI family transcriptional regulator